MKKRNLVLFGSAAMLSLALAGSLGTFAVASAATITQDEQTQNKTTVTYSVKDSWEVTIPDTITIGEEGGEVKADKVVIEQGKQLKITVASKNKWTVQGNGKSIQYELKTQNGEGGTITDPPEGDIVLTTGAGATKTETLKATLKNEDDKKYSTGGAAYEDELTFTVTVEDAD